VTARILPPCQAACPVHTDAGGYARLIAEGRYAEAYEVICSTNPFPSVCAHICQRPCEKSCRRAQVDAAVAIRALKRFVVERVGGCAPPQQVAPEADKARVAVVGAGPAGLTAAQDLRLAGHRVTVFERLERAGGMLNVIPRYRLPQEALDADIQAILGTGVAIRYGAEVGRQMPVTDLLERGFEALIVTTGLSRSRGIAVPGFGAQRFVAAIPWMADVWMGGKVDLGRRVAVIGGGNVAVDVARTARRLGAEDVSMVFLESWEECPAEAHEIELARGEGIRMLPRQALKRVFNRDGEIVAIELMAVVSVFDEAGRFRPTYDPSRIRTLGADMVILSIGQAPDRSWARGAAIRTDERGRIVASRDTHATSHPRVFLAGESLRGPGSAIEAIADGHRVAEVVARFLGTGQAVAPALDDVEPLAPFPPDVVERLRTLTPAATEAQPFDEAEPSLAEREAVAEADRCLGCLAGAVIDETKCATCLTCLRVCPLDAIEIREDIVANPARCQACGVCASHCPAGAIELSYGGLAPAGEARWAAAQAGAAEPAIVRCRHRTNGQAAEGRVLTLPCLARLKPIELLRLFRDGARHVELHACAEEDCKYGGAWQSIEAVAGYVRNVLRTVLPEATLTVRLPDEQATPAEAADSAEAATLPREGGPAGGPA